MPYGGDKLPPEEIARLLYHEGGFRDFDLIEMTATVLAESQGYTQAYNDNTDSRGRVQSRDVGLGQINIRRREVGTKKERDLHDPVKNVRAIRKLFDTRETLTKRRRFNPWYAYTLGWATFPEWWVYRSKEVARAKGLPREWIPTGRYLHEAIVGVANFYANEFHVPHFQLTLPREPAKPKAKPFDGEGRRPRKNRGHGHGRD